MVITIVSVGSKPKPEALQSITDYEKRLPHHVHVSWRFLKHGSGDPVRSLEEESESILNMLSPDDFVILLDESGVAVTSEKFSRFVFENTKNVTFVIGGAYGVNDNVIERADQCISFGKMVLPHQLMRLILIEQIYRGYCIVSGHPYHHA